MDAIGYRIPAGYGYLSRETKKVSLSFTSLYTAPSPMTSPEPSVSTDLILLEQSCWRHLASVPDAPAHACLAPGFKTMTIASRSERGADLRTVVLRKVDPDRKYVWFHTDVRASKVMQLEAFPAATLLFWDEALRTQLRLTVDTYLHASDYVADEHWKTVGMPSRKNYLSEYEPGSVQPAPYPGFPPQLGANLPTEAESEAGRPNFAVIECRVLTMDYLRLSREGQTRALFQYEPEARLVWLAP